MASVPKEFVNVIKELKGLRANKDYTRFHFRFKINGKDYYKTFDFTKQLWTPKVRKTNARKQAEAYKEKKTLEMENPFNPDTKLNFIANEYFTKKCTPSDWTTQRIRQYELYIKPFIGDKRVGKIIEHDVDKIRSFMESNGFTKQNKGGCSQRTIEKVLIQILKPLLEYARNNGAIEKVPNITIPNKKRKKKKRVTDGTQKLSTLFKAIQTRYKDDPFYRAMFMFALYGRRWNEIATLEWSDIDFENNRYTIRAENNKINEDQVYDLPHHIKEPLSTFRERRGLVFKSPKTGGKMYVPKKHVAKLKEDTGIEELTMHYFRHVLVTALGEMGTAATILSASLGHTRAETVDEVYRTVNHLKGSQSANKQLENIIDIEVMENE